MNTKRSSRKLSPSIRIPLMKLTTKTGMLFLIELSNVGWPGRTRLLLPSMYRMRLKAVSLMKLNIVMQRGLYILSTPCGTYKFSENNFLINLRIHLFLPWEFEMISPSFVPH